MDQVIEQVVETKEEVVELTLTELAQVGGGVQLLSCKRVVSTEGKGASAPFLFACAVRGLPASGFRRIGIRIRSATFA